MVDYGKIGLWLKLDGTDDDLSVKNLQNILSNYIPEPRTSKRAFHLKYGGIDLPYLEQERTYARFEGHQLGLNLEIDMNETNDIEEVAIAERLTASMATRYAPGVNVDIIRSGNRTAAGLKGEELVMRMSASGEETQIQFCWEYRGVVDSGEHPEIQITMETSDDNLHEKLKVWDSLISSFSQLYR